MSIKKEIYYKFIFPTYESLSGSDSDPIPTSDSVDQIGEVRALCRECPERVITYDKLDSTLKSYVDTWVSIPKYFNLRNYWDANPCQEGGMSLIVSHTPENLGNSWTKFKVGTKTIYCSLVISSGDFFYGFTLPDEVIEKSGLRDKIVKERFHQNWYFNDDERVTYNNTNYGVIRKLHTDYPEKYKSAMNPHYGQEKRVFVQHYFVYPGFHYVYQGTAKSYINFRDTNNNVYQTSDVYYRDRKGNEYSQTNYFDEKGAVVPDASKASYFTENLITTEDKKATCDVQTISVDGTCGYFLTTTNTPVTRYKYTYKGSIVHSRKEGSTTIYYIRLASPLSTGKTDLDVALYYNVEEYKELTEDLKSDFVDLEVTRRILYYNTTYPNKLKYNNNYIDIVSTDDIPTIVNPVDISYTSSGPSSDLSAFLDKEKGDATYLEPLHPERSGSNTVLSYQPPDVYRTDKGGCPPLQIPYNLLRYCLNDRPPFSDCETVLVMWVADKDPMSSDITSVADLHNKCNFQQYAIPISCRCCFKDGDTCNTDRFLVLYPHGATNEAVDEYAFHFRRSAKYDGTFKEALYLQDLIRYSNDYIISLRYKSLEANFIQRYLFENARSSFKELYVRKGYEYTNREKQFYYVKVDKSLYDIDTNIETCFVKPGTTTQFEPSTALEDKYQDWDLDKEDWVIRDDWFIALFATNNTAISTSTGKLTLIDSPDLKSKLISIDGRHSWEDIYLSSLGISPYSQIDHDFMKLSGSISGDTVMLPLDVLDGYIQIGDTRYGSTINNKIVIGFKDVFDYTNDDCHHFKYVGTNYVLTKNQDYLYTAYVMSST